MAPLKIIAVYLMCALPSGALPNTPSIEDPSRIVANIVSAYEKGEPVDTAATPTELKILETSPSAFYRGLPAVLKHVSAFQKARAPMPPVCPDITTPKNTPEECVMAAARTAAKKLGIVETARQNSAALLYLSLYLTPVNATPGGLAAATARSGHHVSKESAARMRQVMNQGKLFKGPGDPGATGSIGSASPVGTEPHRGINAALEEARRTPRAPHVAMRLREVPSLSDSLAASAREDETVLKHGLDDGTWGTAVGRSLTQVKKTGSEILSGLTNGKTWRRLGSGTVDLAKKPEKTLFPIRHLAGLQWNGLKADIGTASNELGNFIEGPTPYRGIAMIGSIGLAVSNAFDFSGAKNLARKGAQRELLEGAIRAERLADNLVGDALDSTARRGTGKSAYNAKINEWKAKDTNGQFKVGTDKLRGRVGVDESVYEDVEKIGVQRGKDCARYGITSCSIANGTAMTTDRAEEAAATVLRKNIKRDAANLDSLVGKLHNGGKQTTKLEEELVNARSKISLIDIGMSNQYSLQVQDVGSTLDHLKIPNRSLGSDPEALASLRQGKTTPAVKEYKQKIDRELVQGNAVMAVIYTGAEGAHAQHAVTILGKGLNTAGQKVYEVFDSNVGRVVQIPAELINPFGAVVVGKTADAAHVAANNRPAFHEFNQSKGNHAVGALDDMTSNDIKKANPSLQTSLRAMESGIDPKLTITRADGQVVSGQLLGVDPATGQTVIQQANGVQVSIEANEKLAKVSRFADVHLVDDGGLRPTEVLVHDQPLVIDPYRDLSAYKGQQVSIQTLDHGDSKGHSRMTVSGTITSVDPKGKTITLSTSKGATEISDEDFMIEKIEKNLEPPSFSSKGNVATKMDINHSVAAGTSVELELPRNRTVLGIFRGMKNDALGKPIAIIEDQKGFLRGYHEFINLKTVSSKQGGVPRTQSLYSNVGK